MIEDNELREIYKYSSAEHLQNLESGLLELEKNSDDETLIHFLFREAHSLKGDSRVTGVKSVETIAHKVEEILGSIKKKELILDPEITDHIYQAIDGMSKLVHEAVTDEKSGVDVDKLLTSLNNTNAEKTLEFSDQIPEVSSFSITSLFIEDEDLRDIYKSSSEEHLEKLESGLCLLEKDPDDEIFLDELLLEAQTFEIDSRMVGREDLETLIHKVEEILEKVKTHQVVFNEVSSRLNQGLSGIKRLVNEAVTGEPSNIDTVGLLKGLTQSVAISLTSEVVNYTSSNEIEKTQTIDDSHHIDTIRVPTVQLDILMTQTGELTVTRVGVNHTAVAINEIANLWEEIKLRRSSNAKNVHVYEEKLDAILNEIKVTATENSSRLDYISNQLNDKVHTLRLLPLSTVFVLFRRMVRDIAKQQGKQVELVLEGEKTTVDKQIIEEIKDPLMHLIRNAIDHGIESPEERELLGKPATATIQIKASKTASNVIIEISDDGRGLDINLIKETAIKRKLCRQDELDLMSDQQVYDLIFLPGFSTRTFITEISGRGVGLDVVRTNIKRLKGNIKVNSNPGEGCQFSLQLGTTLSTANVMLLEVANIIYALPLEYLYMSLLVAPQQISFLEVRQIVQLEKQAIPIIELGTVLNIDQVNRICSLRKRQNKAEQKRPFVIIKIGREYLGLLVDDLLHIEEVILKPQSTIVEGVSNISGATILGNGEVCMILNPPDIIKLGQQFSTQSKVTSSEDSETVIKPVILLVEDSIAVRTQEKRILEKAGYEVITAVDGLDGLKKLKAHQVDGIISDVEMPNLTGLEFTEEVRKNSDYRELPLILITSLASEEDKKRGADAGANAYIVKDQFNQGMLLETLDRLV